MMKDGKPVINGWCAIPSTASAEAMAHQGWDSLTVDMQHGLVDYSNALPMMQTISTTDVTPLARVNWNEPGQIMKILDAGCYGIICPMVSNKKEAENFVQACMYPPDGYRSFGPVRGLIYGGADYADHANEEILKSVLNGSGQKSHMYVVALNAALVLWAAGIEDDLNEGFNKALFSINQGDPWKKFLLLKNYLSAN